MQYVPQNMVTLHYGALLAYLFDAFTTIHVNQRMLRILEIASFQFVCFWFICRVERKERSRLKNVKFTRGKNTDGKGVRNMIIVGLSVFIYAFVLVLKLLNAFE